jgi:hypothetical protein
LQRILGGKIKSQKTVFAAAKSCFLMAALYLQRQGIFVPVKTYFTSMENDANKCGVFLFGRLALSKL